MANNDKNKEKVKSLYNDITFPEYQKEAIALLEKTEKRFSDGAKVDRQEKIIRDNYHDNTLKAHDLINDLFSDDINLLKSTFYIKPLIKELEKIVEKDKKKRRSTADDFYGNKR